MALLSDNWHIYPLKTLPLTTSRALILKLSCKFGSQVFRLYWSDWPLVWGSWTSM